MDKIDEIKEWIEEEIVKTNRKINNQRQSLTEISEIEEDINDIIESKFLIQKFTGYIEALAEVRKLINC
jgi:wobble nucleotide-excising tRNase